MKRLKSFLIDTLRQSELKKFRLVFIFVFIFTFFSPISYSKEIELTGDFYIKDNYLIIETEKKKEKMELAKDYTLENEEGEKLKKEDVEVARVIRIETDDKNKIKKIKILEWEA